MRAYSAAFGTLQNGQRAQDRARARCERTHLAVPIIRRLAIRRLPGAMNRPERRITPAGSAWAFVDIP